eukprot:scaffold60552_cov28-Tisochrysis_lutea.AAC.2
MPFGVMPTRWTRLAASRSSCLASSSSRCICASSSRLDTTHTRQVHPRAPTAGDRVPDTSDVLWQKGRVLNRQPASGGTHVVTGARPPLAAATRAIGAIPKHTHGITPLSNPRVGKTPIDNLRAASIRPDVFPVNAFMGLAHEVNRCGRILDFCWDRAFNDAQGCVGSLTLTASHAAHIRSRDPPSAVGRANLPLAENALRQG